MTHDEEENVCASQLIISLFFLSCRGPWLRYSIFSCRSFFSLNIILFVVKIVGWMVQRWNWMIRLMLVNDLWFVLFLGFESFYDCYLWYFNFWAFMFHELLFFWAFIVFVLLCYLSFYVIWAFMLFDHLCFLSFKCVRDLMLFKLSCFLSFMIFEQWFSFLYTHRTLWKLF